MAQLQAVPFRTGSMHTISANRKALPAPGPKTQAHVPSADINGRSSNVRLVGLALLLLCATSSYMSAQTSTVPPEFIQATQDMREGRLQEAADGFAGAVKRQPAFAEAHFNLGLVDEELGKYDEAVASLHEALKLKPRLHGANLFLGIAEFRMNHLDEAAAEALDKAAKLKPGDQDILYHRGRAHLLVSKNSYAEMFKVDSNSWLVHRVLAQANAEAERHVDAIAEYEAAIKIP